MLKICLVFWKSEPQYAYKLYAYKKKKHVSGQQTFVNVSVCDPFSHSRHEIYLSKAAEVREERKRVVVIEHLNVFNILSISTCGKAW